MKGRSGSPYDFEPKIADFGLYSRVRTAKAKSSMSGSMGLDHYGNQLFSTLPQLPLNFRATLTVLFCRLARMLSPHGPAL